MNFMAFLLGGLYVSSIRFRVDPTSSFRAIAVASGPGIQAVDTSRSRRLRQQPCRIYLDWDRATLPNNARLFAAIKACIGPAVLGSTAGNTVRIT
jgi:hypothetical protein